MINYDIIVSAENSTYLAWQTLLFCSSAIAKLGTFPTVVVANAEKELHSDFRLLERWGCKVIEHKSFTEHPLGNYPPRNELASLAAVGEALGHLPGVFLFCEADMLFTQRPERNAELSGQFYSYMDYSETRHQSVLAEYALQDTADYLNTHYCIGVPYTMPYALAKPLASRWIEVLDKFEELQWIDIMYSFGIAAASLGHHFINVSDMCDNWSSSNLCVGSILHYCYGDSTWNKRNYTLSSPLDEIFHRPADSSDDMVSSEIAMQLEIARSYVKASQVTYE